MRNARERAPRLWTFLALAGAVALAVFWRFLLFKAVYLYTDVGNDTITEDYPRLLLLLRYLRAEGLPGWSFHVGLGENIFPQSLSDPFWLLLPPLGERGLAYGMAYLAAFKLLLAGALFFLYLRRLSCSPLACAAGALAFSFSGYVVLGSGWHNFETQAVVAAFLLYAFERFLLDESWALLPAAAGLISLTQPFFLYPFALLLGVYGTARFFDEKGWKPRAYGAFALKAAGCWALGAALGGVMMLPDLRQLLQSPRFGEPGSSNFARLAGGSPLALASAKLAVTALARLFSSDLLGTGWDYRGWYNYFEGPLFYCGLSTLLLVPQGLAALPARRRAIYGALLAAALLPTLLPFFRHAFWAFSGDYFRLYSLAVVVSLLFLAAQGLSALERRRRLDLPLLGASLAAALALLFSLPGDAHLRNLIAILLVGHAGALYLLGRESSGLLFLVLVCLESGALSSITVSKRDYITASQWRSRAGYHDYTNEAVAWLKSVDHGFFRVDKDYPSSPAVITSYNDAQVQDYFGTAEHSQFSQPSYQRFLREAGVIDPARDRALRDLPGLWGRPKLESLVGVKYLLSKNGLAERLPIAAFGDVKVYRNAEARPLAFAGRGAVRASLKGENRVEGSARLAEPGVVFFSIPYDDGWSALVDGKPAALKTAAVGFLGLPLEAGAHELELRFTPPLRAAGAALSVLALAVYAALLTLSRGRRGTS